MPKQERQQTTRLHKALTSPWKFRHRKKWCRGRRYKGVLRGVAPVPQQRYIQHAVCPGRRTSLGEVIEKLGNAGHLFGVPRLPDNLATHHNQVNVEVDRKELVEIAADYAAAGTSLHLLGIDSGRGGATGPYLRIVRSSTIRRSKA